MVALSKALTSHPNNNEKSRFHDAAIYLSIVSCFDLNSMLRVNQLNQSVLDQLAEFCSSIRVEELSTEVIEKAKLCIIDSLSASLTIGSTLEAQCALVLADQEVDSSQIKGCATIFGTTRRVRPALAAMVNGITAAGTSRGDTHTATACHPGTIIIPAVLSLAESRLCSGKNIIESLVAGYEVMCRLGQALITPEFSTTFRPTGMLGPTAAAMAAGRVIGLNRNQLSNAASLATHTASGFNEWTNSGTSELAFHSGFAARSGIECVLLAQAGAISAQTILEGPAGLLNSFGVLSKVHLLTQNLGRNYKLLEIVYKLAPACIFVQTPCQLAKRVLDQYQINYHDIAHINIHVSRTAAMYPGCDDAGPVLDPQAAKLSMQFCVASVFVAGGIFDANWRSFNDLHVRSIANNSKVFIDDLLTAHFPERQGCWIEVILKNGATLSAEQEDFISMSYGDVIDRYMISAKAKLGEANANKVIELVDRLERLTDINKLMACLRPSD